MAEVVVGYLSDSCNLNQERFIIVDSLLLSLAGVGIILLSLIGWKAIKMVNEKKRIRKSLKTLFYTAFSFAFIVFITSTIRSVMFIFICVHIEDISRYTPMAVLGGISDAMTMVFHDALMICLLANLFIRLDITFGGSQLAISRKTKRIFMALIVFNSFVYLLLLASIFYTDVSLVMFFLIIFWVIYVSNSIALTWAFTNNLIRVSQFSITSAQNVLDCNNLELNVLQKKMVRLSAKYLALFGVAVSTSFVVFCIQLFTFLYRMAEGDMSKEGIRIIEQFYWCTVVVDVFVNIVCLLLQFAHMGFVYRKYCRRIDLCCTQVTASRIKCTIKLVVRERNQKKKTQQQDSEQPTIVNTSNGAESVQEESISV